ncbi:hypothetical protein CYMTET_33152, partial [Cymbomonas tetramitiformis]
MASIWPRQLGSELPQNLLEQDIWNPRSRQACEPCGVPAQAVTHPSAVAAFSPEAAGSFSAFFNSRLSLSGVSTDGWDDAGEVQDDEYGPLDELEHNTVAGLLPSNEEEDDAPQQGFGHEPSIVQSGAKKARARGAPGNPQVHSQGFRGAAHADLPLDLDDDIFSSGGGMELESENRGVLSIVAPVRGIQRPGLREVDSNLEKGPNVMDGMLPAD